MVAVDVEAGERRTNTGATVVGLAGQRRAHRRGLARLGGVGILVVFVAAACFGLFGPRQEFVRQSDDDWTLTMEHGSVVRSGQPVPMEITVRRTGGFDGPVTLVFAQEIFDRFDFQNWYPNPDSETAAPGTVTYEFAPPDGERLHVSLDARVAPLQLGGRFTYWLGVEVEGRVLARTEYVMWMVP